MPERELNERLAALAQDVGQAMVLSPAAHVRRRGDRRRTRVLGLAAVAAGVVTAGTGVALGAGGGGVAVGGGAVTGIPATLVMPHEGEEGWERLDDATMPSVFAPCDGPDVTQPGRTDARRMTGPGRPEEQEHSPTTITNELFLYEDAPAAEAAFNTLTRDSERCGWLGGLNGDTVYGLNVLIVRDALDSDQPMRDVIAFRRGNVIYLSHARMAGASMSSGDYPAVRVMGDRLCAVLRLCEPTSVCFRMHPSPSAPTRTLCPTGFVESPYNASPEGPWQPGPSYPFDPSWYPSIDPTMYPSIDPSMNPSVDPTRYPTHDPVGPPTTTP